jgi:subtilase family serine protease
LTATADCNNAIVESDETDNSLSRPNIPVTTIGDINGDGVINIFDAVVISLAWGSKPADSYWNVRADMNHDNKIDLLDGIRIASHWGETW